MDAPSIKTERLVLERLTLKFCSETYVNWMNDPEVIQFLESGGDYTIDKLNDYLINVEKSNIYFWAIVLKEKNKHIGNIKIDPINYKHFRGEYGILLGDKTEWGKGYAFEASEEVIRFCFNSLNLRKITLGVVEANKLAIQLYRKLGFIEEGLYKDHSLHNGRFYNTLRMAIFNSAWSG